MEIHSLALSTLLLIQSLLFTPHAYAVDLNNECLSQLTSLFKLTRLEDDAKNSTPDTYQENIISIFTLLSEKVTPQMQSLVDFLKQNLGSNPTGPEIKENIIRFVDENPEFTSALYSDITTHLDNPTINKFIKEQTNNLSDTQKKFLKQNKMFGPSILGSIFKDIPLNDSAIPQKETILPLIITAAEIAISISFVASSVTKYQQLFPIVIGPGTPAPFKTIVSLSVLFASFLLPIHLWGSYKLYKTQTTNDLTKSFFDNENIEFYQKLKMTSYNYSLGFVGLNMLAIAAAVFFMVLYLISGSVIRTDKNRPVYINDYIDPILTFESSKKAREKFEKSENPKSGGLKLQR